jgi:hypothetical protein
LKKILMVKLAGTFKINIAATHWHSFDQLLS